MILILSEPDDPTARYVVGKLQRRGANLLWFNNAQFPAQGQISLSYDGSRGQQRRLLRLGEQQFDLNQITAAWNRYHGPPLPHEELADQISRRFVERHARSFLSELWQTLDCMWVPGVRATVLRAEQKARQLALAAELGFEVAPTLITNSPEEFLDFYRQHRGQIVSKPIHNGGVFADSREIPGAPLCAMVYSEVVTPRDVGYASSIRYCPVIFQAYVPKRLELRVTVVGDRVFACEIHSQQTHKTRHDWRRYDLEHTPHKPHTLPEEIRHLCLRLVERLEICYGALDLILTPDGRYVFIEINPNGQYAWIEKLTGLPITDALCDLLMSRES